MNVILVGGDGDGQRVTLRDGTLEYRHAVREPVRVARVHPSLVGPSEMRVETYVFFEMSPPTLEVIFARHGLTPKEVLARLIDGYRRT